MAQCHGPLTPSDALAAYIYIFALIVRRLAAAASPGSLATWRWWSDALAAACVAGLGGWRAPRGAGECGLLGNCGWIGCFSQPQCHSRYSSPFPSPQRHFFPPSSRTSLMRKLPTVAGGGGGIVAVAAPFPGLNLVCDNTVLFEFISAFQFSCIARISFCFFA